MLASVQLPPVTDKQTQAHGGARSRQQVILLLPVNYFYYCERTRVIERVSIAFAMFENVDGTTVKLRFIPLYARTGLLERDCFFLSNIVLFG